MSTRAGAATIAFRAKQNLVRILFGPSSSSISWQQQRQQEAEIQSLGQSHHERNIHPRHSMDVFDHTLYTYADLKKAYLERVHQLHPDKQKQLSGLNDNDNNHQSSNDTESISAMSNNPIQSGNHSKNNNANATEFVELQDAWQKYEEIAKLARQVRGGVDTKTSEPDFTMFGVGCSFSDSETERELRNEIMDQASKGWFPSGELGTGTSEDHDGLTFEKKHQFSTKLTSDDLFVVSALNSANSSTESDTNDLGTDIIRSSKINRDRLRKSLIGHVIPRNLR